MVPVRVWSPCVLPLTCQRFPAGRRPESDSAVATVRLTAAVDVFNALNTEWEPFVESWTTTVTYCAVDHGEHGSSVATGVFNECAVPFSKGPVLASQRCAALLLARALVAVNVCGRVVVLAGFRTRPSLVKFALCATCLSNPIRWRSRSATRSTAPSASRWRRLLISIHLPCLHLRACPQPLWSSQRVRFCCSCAHYFRTATRASVQLRARPRRARFHRLCFGTWPAYR